MKLNNAILKERIVVGNMYVYTYVLNEKEIKIAKLIPTIKEVVVEGDNNNVIVPVVPDKVTIRGNNNTVTVQEEELVVPYFLTPEYKTLTRLKAIVNKLLNK